MILSSFIVEGVRYFHSIDTKDDSTSIIDENENVIYRVDADAQVYKNGTELIGRFLTDDNGSWMYRSFDEKVISTIFKSLIKAETFVFKQMLK